MDDASTLALFPPDWAFVVQLQAGTPFAAAALRGRVEHVKTGHAISFGSLEEVRAFMERVMTHAGGRTP